MNPRKKFTFGIELAPLFLFCPKLLERKGAFTRQRKTLMAQIKNEVPLKRDCFH